MTKGVLSALLGGLAMFVGSGPMHTVLADPTFLEWILQGIGFVLVMTGGVADGVKSDDKLQAPHTELDPYPGYEYDPIRGWVKKDE